MGIQRLKRFRLSKYNIFNGQIQALQTSANAKQKETGDELPTLRAFSFSPSFFLLQSKTTCILGLIAAERCMDDTPNLRATTATAHLLVDG